MKGKSDIFCDLLVPFGGVIAHRSCRLNKWPTEKLSKYETTISPWCTNESHPSMVTFVGIAKHLKVDIKEQINSIKK